VSLLATEDVRHLPECAAKIAPQPQDDGLHVIADNLVFDHGDLWKPSAISLQLAFFDL
jgi:hypothetical protein